MSEARFSTAVAVSHEELERANHEGYLQYKLDHAAMDLGMLILKEKGWDKENHDDFVEYRRSLYVFTAAELREFVKSKGGWM